LARCGRAVKRDVRARAAPGGRRGAIFMDRPGAIAEIAGSTHSHGIAAIWEPATTPRRCAFFSK